MRTALRMNVKKTLSEGLSDRHIKYREDGHQLIDDSKVTENKVMLTYNETFKNPNKKIVYTVDKNIDVDDI